MGAAGLHLADWIVIVVYLAGITGVGLYVSRGVRSEGDFFMGGRRFGKLFAMLHMFGTGTHTDHPVSVSGKAHEVGLAGIWYQWLWLFCTPFYWLLGPVFRRMRYVTTGDFFQRRYGAGLGEAYAVLGITIFMLNIGIMLNGTGRTVEAISSGGISITASILVMAVLFVLYSVAGGLVAAVITDAIQSVFIVILSFVMVPALMGRVGGFAGLHQMLPPERFSLVAPGDVTVFFIVMTVVNGLVNIVTQPHTLEICGVARDEKAAAYAFCFGPFIKRFCTVAWAFIGLAAIVLYPHLSHHEEAWGAATRDLLPVGGIGLMLASMMAAVMSSCDSFMVDASALFTRNLYARFAKLAYVLPGAPLVPVLAYGALAHYRSAGLDLQTGLMTVLTVLSAALQAALIVLVQRFHRRRQGGDPVAEEREHLLVGRIVAIMVVAGGIGFALAIPSVVRGLKYFWVLSALMGPAWWLGVCWRRANRWGAWASFLGAVGAWLFGMFVLGWDMKTKAHYLMALYLPVAFGLHIAVSCLTAAEPRQKLRDFYALLRTPVGQEQKLEAEGVEVVLH